MFVIFDMHHIHYSCILRIGRLVVTYDMHFLSDKVECMFLFNIVFIYYSYFLNTNSLNM